MKNQSSVPAENSWAQLAIFRIYKDVFPGDRPTLRIFKNSRQQCRVDIALVALDANNNKVTIPEADLEKIELIDYVTGVALEKVTDFSEYRPGWVYSTKHQGYLWDESMILATAEDSGGSEEVAEPRGEISANESPSMQADHQVVTYYVSTDSLSTKQIAARIPLGNASFKTNANIDDPDGKGNGSGSFNSYVEIRSVNFPSLPASDYGDMTGAGTLVPHKVGNSDHFYRATEYLLHVRFRNELLALKSVSALECAMKDIAIHKQGGANDNEKWGISYYGQPGKSNVENFPYPPLKWVLLLTRNGDENSRNILYDPMDMFTKCVGSIVNASETRVVIGLLTGNLQSLLKDESYNDVRAVTSEKLYIMDVYGNRHALSLSFGDKVGDLRITKA